MTVEIVDVAYGGAGVARTADGVLFIPGAHRGERVTVEITERRKKFTKGKLLDIVTASPERIIPEHPIAPGMTYAHLTYPAEVALKQHQLETLLHRIGRFEGKLPLLAPVASPHFLHYRNKLTLRSDGKRLGYVGEDNRTIQDIDACPLSADPINEALTAFRKGRRPKAGSRVVFRYTPRDGVVHFPFGAPSDSLPTLTERLAGLDFEVAADAFFQVNPACAELLFAAVQARLRPCDAVLDLYCGVGVFGCVAAQTGIPRVYGVEVQASAVAAARRNAERLGIHAQYQCLPGEALPAASAKAPCWIVDPPRDGLSEAVRTTLLTHLPEQVVYVSCGPDTLARDLKALAPAYQIESLQLFDFFPRTPHFETLTLLRKRA